MRCELFSEPVRFLDVTRSFLAENEAENTVLVGRALRCVDRPRSGALMAVVQDGDAVRLVAMVIPPHALVCRRAAPRASRVWSKRCTSRASSHRACSASSRWPSASPRWGGAANRGRPRPRCGRSSTAATVSLRPGTCPASCARHLTTILHGWPRGSRFSKQAGLSAAERAADMRAVVAARIARGEMYSWAVEGRPVSSAAFILTTPACDAGRINAVFTPEEERGRGYASACVAALSRRLLDRGWRYCLVFADRGNPITTRMYPRLGYREIARLATIGLRDD